VPGGDGWDGGAGGYMIARHLGGIFGRSVWS